MSNVFYPRVRAAAILFGILTIVVVAFQVALATGMPWGHLTMGGAFSGQLPANMRVAAVGQALLLLLFGLVVATRAGLVLPRWYHASRKLVWVVVAYTVVGTILNAVTPSVGERAIWLPVSLILGTCAFVVAKSRATHAG